MRKTMLSCFAVLGLFLCGYPAFFVDQANGQSYGQVQWGQTMGTNTPNVVIWDGAQNVPIGQINTTTHLWSPVASGNFTVSGTIAAGGNMTVGGTASVTGTMTLGSQLIAGDPNDYLATYAYFGGGTGLIRSESGGGNNPGATAGVFSTRTKNNPSATGYATGNASWFFQDNTTQAVQGAGRYTEARRYNGVPGPALGQEIEITDFSTSTALNPYTSPALAALSSAMWIGSGGGCASGCYNALTGLNNATPNDVSGGIMFFNNGAKFRAPLVFGAGSITGDNTGGGGGFGTAIAMANGHVIKWFSPDGTYKAAINSAESNLGYLNFISFADEAVQFGGHVSTALATGKAAPTIASGGGSGPAFSGSPPTDVSGAITLGSGTIPNIVMNFGTAWATPPPCVVTPSSMNYNVGASATTTQLSVAFNPSITTAVTIYYHCFE